MIDAIPATTRDPVCPLCRQPLFGRTVWFKTTGNCHDSCVEQVVVDEIAARALTGGSEG